MRHRVIKLASAATVAAIYIYAAGSLLTAAALPVYADNLSFSTAAISAERLIAGDTYNGEATFVLSAESDREPMPDGSVGGEVTAVVSGAGTVDFGSITYDYPDAYYYTISRKAAGGAGLTEDMSVYRVMVAAYNDGTSDVIITDSESGEKTEMAFYRDSYAAPDKPGTGDSTDITFYPLMLAVSIALLTIVTIAKKGRHVWVE